MDFIGLYKILTTWKDYKIQYLNLLDESIRLMKTIYICRSNPMSLGNFEILSNKHFSSNAFTKSKDLVRHLLSIIDCLLVEKLCFQTKPCYYTSKHTSNCSGLLYLTVYDAIVQPLKNVSSINPPVPSINVSLKLATNLPLSHL